MKAIAAVMLMGGLLQAGADIIVPDYRDLEALMDLLAIPVV